MNLADPIGFDGIVDPAMKPHELVQSLISRLELFRGSLIDQLRKEPTVFHADPVNSPELVEGAKAGDVAVWQDDLGVQHFKILGLS